MIYSSRSNAGSRCSFLVFNGTVDGHVAIGQKKTMQKDCYRAASLTWFQR